MLCGGRSARISEGSISHAVNLRVRSAVAQPTFGARLPSRGFKQIKHHIWVRSAKAPIREVIKIWTLNAARYIPVCSLSLGTVPHVTSSGEIGWHRTAKTLRSDLCVDPTNTPNDVWHVRPCRLWRPRERP